LNTRPGRLAEADSVSDFNLAAEFGAGKVCRGIAIEPLSSPPLSSMISTKATVGPGPGGSFTVAEAASAATSCAEPASQR
jgi:hypothetical protein